MTAVLFVCLGNICRSPTAEGVFRHLCQREGLVERVYIDSAGTGAWHVGKSPDSRAQVAALTRGIDLSGQRARQVQPEDFERFDYLLAMDLDNLQTLRDSCPDACRARLHLFLDFAEERGPREVPDPYYGGDDGFEQVLDLVEAASRGLLAKLRSDGAL